jgi:hypothetical protein
LVHDRHHAPAGVPGPNPSAEVPVAKVPRTLEVQTRNSRYHPRGRPSASGRQSSRAGTNLIS